MATKTEPLVCELSVPPEKKNQLSKLVDRWNLHVEEAKANEAKFANDMREAAEEVVERFRGVMLASDDDTEENYGDKPADDMTAEKAMEEHIGMLAELADRRERDVTPTSYAHIISLTVTDQDDVSVVTIQSRNAGENDWDATLAAVQYVVNELQLRKPVQLTWSHHELLHGGDCRHLAVVQAGCKPVVEVRLVNEKQPTIDPDDFNVCGWCTIKVAPGKEPLAAQAVIDWRKQLLVRKAQISRIVAGVEPQPNNDVLEALVDEATGVLVAAFDKGNVSLDITPGAQVSTIKIGHNNSLVPSAVGNAMRFFKEYLGISETLRCAWAKWCENDRYGECTVGEIVIADGEPEPRRPKVTVYHGEAEPTVEVENEDLVDVQVIDTAERDLLVVAHKGYSIYWAIKDSSSNGEYFASDYWVVPYPWIDHESEYAFDIRDLPTLPDMDMRDYAANYPDADQYQLRLIYAIDTDQLPIDISEFRAGYYEA